LPEFLENFPLLKKHPVLWKEKIVKPDRDKCMKTLNVDNIPEVERIKPGEKAANKLSSQEDAWQGNIR
jgi:hypothetical protein